MVLRKSSIIAAAAVLAGLASQAVAEDYNTNYGSRSDFISLSAGDALRSNIAIQHPTPWPSYVNNTKFLTPARQGASALENMFKRYEAEPDSQPSTIINIGK